MKPLDELSTKSKDTAVLYGFLPKFLVYRLPNGVSTDCGSIRGGGGDITPTVRKRTILQRQHKSSTVAASSLCSLGASHFLGNILVGRGDIVVPVSFL